MICDLVGLVLIVLNLQIFFYFSEIAGEMLWASID
jgi:hypothetical protein